MAAAILAIVSDVLIHFSIKNIQATDSRHQSDLLLDQSFPIPCRDGLKPLYIPYCCD